PKQPVAPGNSDGGNEADAGAFAVALAVVKYVKDGSGGGTARNPRRSSSATSATSRSREAALAARESAAVAEAEAAAVSAARAEADERARLELRLLASEEAGASARRECARLRDAFKSARESSAQLRRQLAEAEAERDRLARAERSHRARLANLGADNSSAISRRCCVDAAGSSGVDVGVQTPAKWMAAAVAAAEAEAAARAATAALQTGRVPDLLGQLCRSPGLVANSEFAIDANAFAAACRRRSRTALHAASGRVAPAAARLAIDSTAQSEDAFVSAFFIACCPLLSWGGAGQRVSGAACVRQLAESLAQRLLPRRDRVECDQLLLLACLLILRASIGDFEARQRAVEALRKRLLESREARRVAVRSLDGGHWLLLAVLQSAEAPAHHWPAAHQRAPAGRGALSGLRRRVWRRIFAPTRRRKNRQRRRRWRRHGDTPGCRAASRRRRRRPRRQESAPLFYCKKRADTLAPVGAIIGAIFLRRRRPRGSASTAGWRRTR
uniref:Golgin-84 n=1 Tax=Macrostomum lignano TaxID=282301 RepID=A0A1I8F2Z5_9PLAT